MHQKRAVSMVVAFGILFTIAAGAKPTLASRTVFRTIGESAEVRQAIQSAFGTRAAPLLRLPPEKLGKIAILDDRVVHTIFRRPNLTDSQRLQWVGVVNNLRLRSGRLDNKRLILLPSEARATAEIPEFKRNFTFTKDGLKIDPSLKLPIYNGRKNKVEIVVDRLTYKQIIAAAAAACTASSSCQDTVDDTVKEILNPTLGSCATSRSVVP
jgi:hypothetical protein